MSLIPLTSQTKNQFDLIVSDMFLYCPLLLQQDVALFELHIALQAIQSYHTLVDVKH